MTPQKIRDAIAADPALQALQADGNHQGIADALSAGRTRLGVVSVEKFQAWCARTGMRATIQDHASNAASPLRAIALTLQDVLCGGAPGGINFGYPGNAEMLDAWLAAGLTTAQRDELLTMATVSDPVNWQAVLAAVQGA